MFGAFFIVLGLLCSAALAASATTCGDSSQAVAASVDYVFDGDTLKLTDGSVIRLIGINTPEIGHDGDPDEPGAHAARQRLLAILQAGGNRVFLNIGKESKDRYQRLLAHLYTPEGRNISAMLLREGMGYAIQIPPNLGNLECYEQAEQAARKARKGLWGLSGNILSADHMSGREEGFYLIRGKVERVGKSKRSLWLNLKQGPAIRIDWSDWQYFEGWNPDDLEGRDLEVRGWIYRRKGQQRLKVRHPAAIHWLD